MRIYEPQLFGFGQEASTRTENHIIIQRQKKGGGYEQVRKHSIGDSPFPEIERHGWRTMRFSFMEKQGFYSGDDGSWTESWVAARYETKQIIVVQTRERRDPN